MNYMIIKRLDIANGPGCRVSLFVSGCPHHCKGCFNPESWSFTAGSLFTDAEKDLIIELLNDWKPYGFSVLGGEPLAPENILTVKKLLQDIRTNVTTNAKNSIWVHTGYKIEEIMNRPDDERDILNYIDVLVDGPFIEEHKDLKLQYCGSKNQRVINVKKILEGSSDFEYDKYKGEF